MKLCRASNDIPIYLPTEFGHSCKPTSEVPPSLQGSCTWTNITYAEMRCEEWDKCAGFIEMNIDEQKHYVAFAPPEVFQIHHFHEKSLRYDAC